MEDWLYLTIFGLTQFFMLVGLFGLVVPVFPGLVVMWLAALGYGIATGFHSTLGIVIFIVLTLLMLVGSFIDNLLMGVGAHRGGASWSTILVALMAGVIGTLAFPPFGGIIAAPLAVVLLQYLRLRDLQKAWESLRGLVTGWGLSFVVRLLIGVVMMGIWWIWVWKG
jgi:uncharacterized protein YqgC (DUF456 family)